MLTWQLNKQKVIWMSVLLLPLSVLVYIANARIHIFFNDVAVEFICKKLYTLLLAYASIEPF